MQVNFLAQPRLLGLSECERLCVRWSRDVEELAQRAGWYGSPGTRFEVPVGTALNMLVLSIAMNHNVEPQAMAAHLPGLRNEALLKLGEDTSNWSFDGPYEAERQFWPMLYGNRDGVGPRIAPLLGCSIGQTTRQLLFFSGSDVGCLSPSQFEQGDSGRAPRFVIDAHDLASRVRSVCGGSLFTAKVATAA